MKNVRVKGLVSVAQVRGVDGDPIPIKKAIASGWFVPDGRRFTGWDLDKDEIVLGENLFVDQGRQVLAYAFGYRSPIENFVCRKFGVGTGITTARVTDVSLESPITLNSGNATGNVDSVDFISPFVVRVAFTLGLNDANGYAITEQGLFTGNDTLITRRVRSVAINKTSAYSLSLIWRLRF